MKTLPGAEPHLGEAEAEEVFGWLLDGETSEDEIARFLVALSDRGETAEEIAGAARALIEHAWAHARALGLTHSALVSVQDSRAFWQKRGYAVVAELSPEQRRLLSTYPGPSDYMARALEI